MKFEVGKFYRSKNDDTLSVAVRTKVTTTQWGSVLLVETTADPIGLVPFEDEDPTDGWVEITEQAWSTEFEETKTEFND